MVVDFGVNPGTQLNENAHGLFASQQGLKEILRCFAVSVVGV